MNTSTNNKVKKKRNYFLTLATLLVIAPTAGEPALAVKEKKAPATEHLPTKQQVETIAARFLCRHRGALVVGITNGSKHLVYGFHQVNETNKSAADGSTIFEIASLSKVLAGLLLADMCVEGQVKLTDPVQRWLPNDVHVPQWHGTAISMLDLATHSSGLPRSPSGRVLSEDFPTRRMHLFINQFKLKHKPGTNYLYSNLGVTLMGEALAQRASMDYETLLRERICTPLSMKNTSIRLKTEEKLRLATGYSEQDSVQPHSGLFACGASGAVKSTADDLLNLLDAYLCPQLHSSKEQALRLSSRVQRRTDESSNIALGWFINNRTGNYEKTGFLPGVRTYMGFSPSNGIGIVVLGASDACPAAGIGHKLLIDTY